MNRNVKVQLTVEDAAALERHARAQDRSVASLIRLAVRAYLGQLPEPLTPVDRLRAGRPSDA